MNTVQNKFKVDTITTVRLGHKALGMLLSQEDFDKELAMYRKKLGANPSMVIYDIAGNKLYFGIGAYGLKGAGVALGQKLVASYMPTGGVSYYEDTITHVASGILQLLARRMWKVEPSNADRTPEARAFLLDEYEAHMNRINRMQS